MKTKIDEIDDSIHHQVNTTSVDNTFVGQTFKPDWLLFKSHTFTRINFTPPFYIFNINIINRIDT